MEELKRAMVGDESMLNEEEQTLFRSILGINEISVSSTKDDSKKCECDEEESCEEPETSTSDEDVDESGETQETDESKGEPKTESDEAKSTDSEA